MTEENEIEQDDIDMLAEAALRIRNAYTGVVANEATEQDARRQVVAMLREHDLPVELQLEPAFGLTIRELAFACSLLDEEDDENEDGEVELSLFELRRKDGLSEDPPGAAYFILEALGDNLADNLDEANELLGELAVPCVVDYAEDDEDVEDDVEALTSDEEE